MTKENPTGTGTFNFTGDEVLTGNLQAAGLTDGTTTKTMTDILASGKLYTTTGQNTDGPMSQKATTDELNAITTALSNKFTNHPQSAYNCNTCYDEGVYLIANGSNCPSGTQYGSLFVMPYRKPTGNTKPDFCVQIYLPNGDDSTHPNSMFYRTSLADSWNNWREVASISDVQAKIDNLQTQINNMLNGTTTFTYLKAKIVDLV